MRNKLFASIESSLMERFGADYDEYESEESRRRRNKEKDNRSDLETQEEQPINLDQAISRFVFGKGQDEPQ